MTHSIFTTDKNFLLSPVHISTMAPITSLLIFIYFESLKARILAFSSIFYNYPAYFLSHGGSYLQFFLFILYLFNEGIFTDVVPII